MSKFVRNNIVCSLGAEGKEVQHLLEQYIVEVCYKIVIMLTVMIIDNIELLLNCYINYE